MEKITQTFFDEKAEKYHQFAHGKQSKEVREKIKQIVDREICGKVIDVGGGGEVHYEISKSDVFVSFDISYKQLKKMPIGGYVYSVCGEAENLPFKNNLFEVAICRCFFHHLAKNNIKRSNILLRKILLEIYEILNQSGKIIIIENCLPKIFEEIENFLFVLFKKILELFKIPMVRFLSSSSISSLLREMGFVDIKVVQMKEKKSWEFASVSIILPFFKIPQRLVPTNHYVIVGKKA